jgi:DNA-binding transcriptional MerR regulator
MTDQRRGPDDQQAPSSGKLIRVVFGPGGGRIPDGFGVPSDAQPGDDLGGAAVTMIEAAPAPPVPGEPVTEVFTWAEVGKLLTMSVARLRSLDRAGVVSPSGTRKGKRAFTFADIIALRAARDLLNQKVRPRDVGKAVASIKSTLPRVTRPLAELRIVSDGKSVVVKSAAGDFIPTTGQLLLNFEVSDLRDAVVRVLRPMIAPDRAKTAYELYLRASELDESPATLAEAEKLYRQAVELDPYLCIAYTNLGNICFRRGDEQDAEKLYRRAIEIDPKQPEAQYNLGYLMLDRGEAREAIGHFQRALDSDPTFADAYFNLAMAHEQLGERAKAKPCWKRYLAIEPSGTWADIARRHLQ